MAHSTPKFSFQSTPVKSYQGGSAVKLQSPKAETLQTILNYSKALEAKQSVNGKATSYVLN